MDWPVPLQNQASAVSPGWYGRQASPASVSPDVAEAVAGISDWGRKRVIELEKVNVFASAFRRISRSAQQGCSGWGWAEVGVIVSVVDQGLWSHGGLPGDQARSPPGPAGCPPLKRRPRSDESSQESKLGWSIYRSPKADLQQGLAGIV